jgi:16S rRNA G966 N2-methylase RsmD
MHLSSSVSATLQRARSLSRKVDRSLKRRGLAGTVKFCMCNISSVMKEIVPSGRHAQSLQSEFDRKFHVDTGGEIHLSDLDIQSPNSAFGNSYQPSVPKVFFEMLGAIDIRYSDYTFIDFGSGKGLVLLLASSYPFRKIIGVEFSPQLHRIAEQNIRNYHNPSQQCRNIQSLVGDVVEYRLPEEPEVLYLFNPFNEPIIEVLVANIRRSLEIHPRPIFVLYKNPIANAVFEKEKALKTVKLTKQYAIYKHERPGA